MDYLRILGIAAIFLCGFFSYALFDLTVESIEMPITLGSLNIVPSLNSPQDWIDEADIQAYENAVVINIKGATLARYAPTGSMKPVLDDKSTGIRIEPKSEEEIEIGDIITFEKDEELIVHRVIDKGEDSNGTYFITKGDNNDITDGKVRFDDIRYITVGVIW